MLTGDDHYAYVIGYSDGNVRPNANVSRAETRHDLLQAAQRGHRDGNLTAENTFTDGSTVSVQQIRFHHGKIGHREGPHG